MPTFAARALRLAVPLGAAVAGLVGALSAHAEKPAPRPPAPRPAEALTPYYVGVGFCVRCHEHGPPQPDGPALVCTCKEADKWLCKDKHHDAYAVLDPAKNPRARRMAELLGYDPRRQPECLSCHSVPGVADDKRPDPPYAEDFRMEDGVGCVSCHGAFDGWLDVHGGARHAVWRKNSRPEKETKFGMTDLWDPARRAEVCGSCHVGDRAENKVVTHLMYAAGHPPLPSFEIGDFCDMLPRHWQLLAEKESGARDLLHVKDGELEQTKLVVVGAAAAFRQAMTLLAADADRAAAEGGAVDFAQMDCASCHHDLQQPSWRQARGYEGRVPGRPGVRDWPLALLPVALPLAGDETFSTEFEDKRKALNKAFDARPYGDPKAVAAAAGALAKWADCLTARLNANAVPYDRPAALDVLRRLARLPAGRAPDYDAARQTAWAFRVVYGEVCREYAKAKDAEGAKTWAALEKSKDQVKAALDALNAALGLDLPTADDNGPVASLPDDAAARKDKLTACAAARQARYDAYVPAMLDKTRDYKPDDVRKAFADLAKLLP